MNGTKEVTIEMTLEMAKRIIEAMSEEHAALVDRYERCLDRSTAVELKHAEAIMALEQLQADYSDLASTIAIGAGRRKASKMTPRELRDVLAFMRIDRQPPDQRPMYWEAMTYVDGSPFHRMGMTPYDSIWVLGTALKVEHWQTDSVTTYPVVVSYMGTPICWVNVSVICGTHGTYHVEFDLDMRDIDA